MSEAVGSGQSGEGAQSWWRNPFAGVSRVGQAWPVAPRRPSFLQPTRGHWAQTASGRMFYPLDPRPEEIFIDDIADGLSRLCRYGGQLRRDIEHYSVAEHSVCLARYFVARGETDLARWALLHDAGELFGELIRPIKSATPDYRAIEARIMAAVCARFGLPRDEPVQVKQADLRITLDERDAVMAEPPAPWDVDALEPLGAMILCYPQAMARAAFLHWFWELFPEERQSAVGVRQWAFGSGRSGR